MAEQAAGAVASAVIGGVTDRALTTVMRKLRSRSRSAAGHDHEKLQRLETLVLKLRCAVEVSEKHAIESASLLEWRDRLREAAAESGAVVLDFQRRAREDADAGAAATSAPGQQQQVQQQQPAATSAASSTAGALYFTRSALCGVARRVRDATRRLFSTDEDMEKLDGALENMEQLSSDITQFLLALQLEVSPRAKRRKRVSIPDTTSKHDVLPKARVPRLFRRAVVESAIVQLAPAEDPEREEARMLARVLEGPLQRMVSCIKAMDDRDMEGLEWVAEWGALLRVAVERGNAAVLQLRNPRPGSDVIHKAGGGALEAGGEVYCFARAVERLELEEQCFAVLMDLCPTKQ